MLQAADRALESASRSGKKSTSEADAAFKGAIQELHEFEQGFYELYEGDVPVTVKMEAAKQKDWKLRRNVLTGKVHAKVCPSHTLRDCNYIYYQQLPAKLVTINKSHHIFHPQVPSR